MRPFKGLALPQNNPQFVDHQRQTQVEAAPPLLSQVFEMDHRNFTGHNDPVFTTAPQNDRSTGPKQILSSLLTTPINLKQPTPVPPQINDLMQSQHFPPPPIVYSPQKRNFLPSAA